MTGGWFMIDKNHVRYDMSSFSRLECWICDKNHACPKLSWKGYKNHLSGARVGNRSKVHQWSFQPKHTHICIYIYNSIIFEDVWRSFSVQFRSLHIPQNFQCPGKKDGKEFNRFQEISFCIRWGIPLSVRLRRRWWITSEAIHGDLTHFNTIQNGKKMA